MGFRRAATIIRTSGGAHVNGRWVKGTEQRIPTKVSVQHLNAGGGEDRRESLPEDERAESTVTIFTSDELFPGGRPGVEADKVEADGKVYLIKSVEPWRNGIFNHYKATAAEVIA